MSDNTDDLSQRQKELQEKLAKLAELKRQRGDANPDAVPQAPSPVGTQKQYPPPICGYGYAERGSAGYDEDDENMFLDDEDENCDEAFGTSAEDAWLEAQESGVAAAADESRFDEPLSNNLSDYKTDKILRLIKFGDVNELKRIEACIGGDAFKKLILSCKDNLTRGALHYAADAASPEMVKFLINAAGVQSYPAENGMTPLDIALLRRSGATAKILATLEQGEDVKMPTLEDLVKKFAPKPPSLIVTKALPPIIPDKKRNRKFWTNAGDVSQTSAVATELNDTNFDHAQAAALVASRWWDRFGANGVLAPWANPPSPDYFAHWALRMHHITCHSTPQNLLGYMSVLPLGQLVVKGATNPKFAYSAAYLTVKDGFDIAAQVLKKTAHYLTDCLCVFRVPMNATKTFPLPMTPLTQLKWFRRCIKPHELLADKTPIEADPLKLDCFGEATTYDFMLTADIVARESILASTETDAECAKPWHDLATLAPEACESAAQLCQKAAVAEFPDATVSWSPDAIRHMFVNGVNEGGSRPADDLVALVRVDEANSAVITDMVVFRRYTCAELTAEGQTTRSALAAVVVTACFFSKLTKKASQRLKAVCHVAMSQLSAQAVYMCTSFGVSESELRSAFFTEVVGRHEALYVATDAKGSGITPAPLPAAKVGIPFFY